MFSLAGSWIDSYAGKAGYNRVFLYATVMGALCMLISGILIAIVKKDKKAVS